MENQALQIKGLTKRYGKESAKATPAVDNISLTVKTGEFFGLLGPNGAGKTTTIHCATGIARFGEGTITTFGHDVERDYREARKQIGLSPQEYNVDFFEKTWRILDWIGGFYGMRKNDRRERTDYLLKRFGLNDHRNKTFRELSGGLKRRMMLARALMNDPNLLILDEPTAGVDVELRHDLWRYLRELNEEGKTIILTSHYLEEVEMLCNRVAIINDGKIIADRPKEDFLKNGNNLEATYLELTKKHG